MPRCQCAGTGGVSCSCAVVSSPTVAIARGSGYSPHVVTSAADGNAFEIGSDGGVYLASAATNPDAGRADAADDITELLPRTAGEYLVGPGLAVDAPHRVVTVPVTSGGPLLAAITVPVGARDVLAGDDPVTARVAVSVSLWVGLNMEAQAAATFTAHALPGGGEAAAVQTLTVPLFMPMSGVTACEVRISGSITLTADTAPAPAGAAYFTAPAPSIAFVRF